MSKHDWTSDPTIAASITDHFEQAKRYRREASAHEEQALKLIDGWTISQMEANEISQDDLEAAGEFYDIINN